MEIKHSDCDAINIDIVDKVKPNMPDMNLLYELSDFFKVMGDSTRIQLLWALEESEMCVGDLAVLLNMTKSAVSHQLKVLRTAKLVRSPLGMKKFFTTTIDESAKDFDTIIFSAGKIGYQVEMSLDELSKLIKFQLNDITV